MSSPITASGTSPALAKQPGSEDQPTPQPNLTERFEILKFLGPCGNSFCFAALDLETEKQVRLKVLSDDAALDGAQKELFYLEAAGAAKLSHQNITRTTEAEELCGVHFCTIEHRPDAESLRDLLDMRSWLEIDVAVSIALQVADALDHAHQAGVLHLNLNPANILIESDGRVLVTNFGIGSGQDLAWAHADRTGRHCAQYASPEQIQGSGVDPRSDLYSLGIILFEMLTDRVPFDSADAELVKRKHLAQAPHPPQLFRQGISNYLSALVVTLLEKNPDWRFRSASQLQASLSRVAPPELALQQKLAVQREHSSEPEPEPQPVEVMALSADQPDELDLVDPQAEFDAPDAEADSFAAPPDAAEPIHDIITHRETHREVFEPPTITKMDPPPRRLPERKTVVEPPPSISVAREVARENIQPFSLHVSSSRAQSRRQAFAFLALMLVILLLLSLLGRNQLLGLFQAASAEQQNDLPDAIAQSQITNAEPASSEAVSPEPAEQTILPEAQRMATESGPSAGAGSLPAKEKVTPPRKRYVRRSTSARFRPSARRKLRVKRKAPRPAYLRRGRAWAQTIDANHPLKMQHL